MYGNAQGNAGASAALQAKIQVPRPSESVSIQNRLTDVLVRLQGLEDTIDSFYHRLIGDEQLKQASAHGNPMALATIAEHIDQTVHRINNVLQNVVAVIG